MWKCPGRCLTLMWRKDFGSWQRTVTMETMISCLSVTVVNTNFIPRFQNGPLWLRSVPNCFHLEKLTITKTCPKRFGPSWEDTVYFLKEKTGNASENYVDAEFWARVSQNILLSKSVCSVHQLKVLILLVCKSPLFWLGNERNICCSW